MVSTAPFISENGVRTALDNLLYKTTNAKQGSALLQLLIVDEWLLDPAVPDREQLRHFALNNILIDVISQQLAQMRKVYNHMPPRAQTSLEQVAKEVREDFQDGNPELACWSVLYHRFVRFDLNLNLDVISQITHLDSRTLRRYQQHGIRRLADQLADMELAARTAQNRRRLYKALPSVPSVPLFGFDSFFQQAETLAQNHTHQISLITGLPGSGKSTFVQEFVRRRIDTGDVERVIWINTPLNAEQIIYSIRETFEPLVFNLDYLDCLQLFHTIIVLDDISTLDEQHRIDALLEQLSSAEIYLTSNQFLPLTRINGRIQLQNLDFESFTLFVRYLAIGNRNKSVDAVEIDQLWAISSGHPLTTKLAYRHLEFGLNYPVELNTPFYEALWLHLPEAAKYTLLSFVFVTEKFISGDILQLCWGDYFGEYDLVTLQKKLVLEKGDGGNYHLTIPPVVLDELVNLPEASVMLVNLLTTLDHFVASQPRTAIKLAQPLLYHKPQLIDNDTFGRWITALCPYGLKNHHYAVWCQLIKHYRATAISLDIEVIIALGVCQRQLGEWPEAVKTFAEAATLAGQRGDFVKQGYGLIELAITYRYQGEYTRSLILLQRVEKMMNRYNQLASILQTVRMEQAQIAIDRGQCEIAQEYLDALTNESLESLLLQSEVALLCGNLDESLAFIARAQTHYEVDKAAEGRLHNLQGRVYLEKGKTKQAEHHLGMAVACLELVEEPLALARAQLNLAAFYVQQGNPEEAKRLLTLSEHMHRKLGDRVALAALKHNLSVLKAMITR